MPTKPLWYVFVAVTAVVAVIIAKKLPVVSTHL
jgi:hypothetical protein